MSEPLWGFGRAALRRWLVRWVPAAGWSREFLAELDRELRQRAESGTGPGLTLWYLRQVLSPATIGFVRAMRARKRRRALPLGGGLTAGLLKDARQAWRGATRDRWAAGLAALTLAVGIGSVAAMHGLGQRLFLSGPPHVEEPGELRRVFLLFDDQVGRRTSPWIPYDTAAAIRDGVAAFEGATLYRLFEDLADLGHRTRPVKVAAVDGHYFDVLGVSPAAGRFFAADDPGTVVLAAPVAVQEFGSLQAALGQTVRIGARTGQVLGVAPAGFAGPDLDRVDAWLPMGLEEAGSRNWWTLGRLSDPAATAAAVDEAEALHRSVDPGRFFQWARDGRISMAGVQGGPTGEGSVETSIAVLLLAVVGLVLVISWANVLNLQLARVARRRSELLVRLALGSGRWRLARLFAVESLLLGAVGGVLSLPLAYAEIALVRSMLLPDVAWGTSVLNADLLAVTTIGVVVSGVLLGLLTARQADRADLSAGLSEARQGPGRRFQTLLVTAQVTLSAALLLCAGLFVKSFWTMRVTDLGVDAERVHTVSLRSLDFTLGGGDAEETARYERALAALRDSGAGDSAALTVGLPFFTNFGMSIHVPGRDSIPELPGGGPFISVVSDRYFETIGTRILRGAPITERDVATRARVAVIGASTAATLWPNGNALGQCVHVGAADDPCFRIVGVAEDVHRRGYREPPSLQLYLPLGATSAFSGSTLLVRSARSGGAYESRLQAELSRAVPGVDYVEVRRLDTFLAPEIRPWKLGAVMLSMVAALAILMSLAGVFGVLTQVVARRRREIGVRMALGASRLSIRALVLRMGMLASVVGVALGFLAVLAGARWLGPLLFETPVADPLVMAAVGIGLVGAAAVACLLPASQAARVDPATSLRADS